jgi:hypothetical protein
VGCTTRRCSVEAGHAALWYCRGNLGSHGRLVSIHLLAEDVNPPGARRRSHHGQCRVTRVARGDRRQQLAIRLGCSRGPTNQAQVLKHRLCPASPSRGGLPGLAGVTTRPAWYPSGGIPPAVERRLHLLTSPDSTPHSDCDERTERVGAERRVAESDRRAPTCDELAAGGFEQIPRSLHRAHEHPVAARRPHRAEREHPPPGLVVVRDARGMPLPALAAPLRLRRQWRDSEGERPSGEPVRVRGPVERQ